MDGRPINSLDDFNHATAIGVVIARQDGNSPNIMHFSFMINSPPSECGIQVHQGQYCAVNSLAGQVVGYIEQIHIFNNYFHDYQTVKNFNKANLNLRHYFPSDEWEIQIAEVQVLGAVHSSCAYHEIDDPTLFKRIQKADYPVKPGNEVFYLGGEMLRYFLGVDKTGITIGRMTANEIPISLNLNRFFNKHVAILAQSGAGKSYLISVILEELLSRSSDQGTPGLVLFDLHGEYRYLKAKLSGDLEVSSPSVGPGAERHEEILSRMQSKIQIVNASFLQIGVADLAPYEFQKFQPNISLPQLRELRKIIGKLSQDSSSFSFRDIIDELIADETQNAKVRDTLIGWLEELSHLRLFADKTSPPIPQLVRPGHLTIIDLSSIISMKKKQILVHFFASQMFYQRRIKKVAPFILFLEEAHNFLPESGGKGVIAKHIFETIAREGRKFFAQLVLVSQRPIRLSTTALSQCNTHIIMRITNPYDLNHIKSSSEALTNEAAKTISNLPTGSALIMGAALNFPVFAKIRKRMLPNQQSDENTLEKVALAYSEKETSDPFPEHSGKIVNLPKIEASASVLDHLMDEYSSEK